MPRYSVISIFVSAMFAFTSTATLAQDQPVNQTDTTTTTTTPTGKVIEKRVIITTTPAPKEVIAMPAGYVSCFTIKAGWNQDIWVTDHNVCTYSNSPQGVVWVEGYWTCNKYDLTSGNCTNWDWKAGHWEKSVTGY